jgi:predicted dehydrogenase
MIRDCQLDAVYIATPNHLHAEMIEGAAAAGLRVLCEKPITTHLNDLTRIRTCTLQHPDFFQTAYDQRYHPAHLKLARCIAEGVLGTVTQVRIHYACWVDGGWNKVSATDNWRIDPSRAGGGAGFDLLPHGLDLISMLVAEPIADAHLIYQGKVHDYAISQAIDDGAVMSVRTVSGILASLHVGYNCPEDQPRRRIEVLGTKGRVDAYNTMGQDPGGELVWHTPAGVKRETFPECVEAGPFVRQLDAVSRLWIRGDVPQFPFERDLALAECLIHCDTRARSNFSPHH